MSRFWSSFATATVGAALFAGSAVAGGYVGYAPPSQPAAPAPVPTTVAASYTYNPAPAPAVKAAGAGTFSPSGSFGLFSFGTLRLKTAQTSVARLRRQSILLLRRCVDAGGKNTFCLLLTGATGAFAGCRYRIH